MMRYEEYVGAAGMSATEQARLHVLFLCFVRFVVEKHGGTMETDPVTHNANISIPRNREDICHHELRGLLEKAVRKRDSISESL